LFSEGWRATIKSSEDLGKVAPLGHEETIRSLLRYLKNSKSVAEVCAARVLGKVAPIDHPAHEEAICCLLSYLHSSGQVGYMALQSLGEIAPLGHEEVIRSLLDWLIMTNKERGASASWAFSEMWARSNPSAEAALPGMVVEDIDNRKYRVNVCQSAP
jgi:hypothetical protein